MVSRCGDILFFWVKLGSRIGSPTTTVPHATSPPPSKMPRLPAIPALLEVMTRIPPLMSLRTRPTPWLRVPWGWWVKRRRRSTRWKASPTTLVVDTEDIPTAQADTTPASVSMTTVASAASLTTPAVSAASPTAQAETAPASAVRPTTPTSLLSNFASNNQTSMDAGPARRSSQDAGSLTVSRSFSRMCRASKEKCPPAGCVPHPCDHLNTSLVTAQSDFWWHVPGSLMCHMQGMPDLLSQHTQDDTDTQLPDIGQGHDGKGQGHLIQGGGHHHEVQGPPTPNTADPFPKATIKPTSSIVPSALLVYADCPDPQTISRQ